MMFEAALVAWLVGLIGDSSLRGARKLALGRPERQALLAALQITWSALLKDIPPDARSPLTAALGECFSDPPAARLDGRMSVKDALIQGVEAQIRPLADPAVTSSGHSYFEELGIDGAQFQAALPDVLVRSIQQAAPGYPALQPLAAQLNADALMERVDQVLDAVQARLHPATGPAAAQAGSAEFLGPVIDAFLAIPSMSDYGTRMTIITMLSPRIRDAIPRSPVARIEILNTFRTCQNYAGGLRELVSTIRFIEGDSEPMKRLDAVILALGDTQADPCPPAGLRPW
jgi:Effector-associated domain 2